MHRFATILMALLVAAAAIDTLAEDELLLAPSQNLVENLVDDSLLETDTLTDGLLADDLLRSDDRVGDRLGPDPLSDLGSADPLSELGPKSIGPNNPTLGQEAQAVDPHQQLWTENCYPSAESCRKCHPSQYEEWRASGHAYAAVSPMFNRFEQAMTEYTKGTVGSFCVRCHSPVGTQLKIPRAASLSGGTARGSRRRDLYRLSSRTRALLAQQR